MFHKIHLPDCAPQLMRLTEIAGRTVAFGLSHDLSILDHYDWDGSEQKGLAKSLGAEFVEAHGGHRLLAAVRQRFLAYFVDWERPEVGKWLWGKYAVVAAPVVKLVALSPAQKEGVLVAFQHDVDLEGIFQQAEPKLFHLRKLREEFEVVQSLIKDLLIGFYESILVAEGVPTKALGEENALDHQEILQSFYRANLLLMVCPGCDGDPPLRASINRRPRDHHKPHYKLWLSANIDHFLPKSKYPFLSVHPLNLVPLCLMCNQERKGDNDPLEPEDVQDLEDIYHPYIRGACGEVAVSVECDEIDGLPHIRLRPVSDEPHAKARLSSLNHVLGLQDDWDGNLQRGFIENLVGADLLHATQDERLADDRHDETWLRTMLGNLSRKMCYDVRKVPHTLVKQAYAAWLATEDAAHKERIRLLNMAFGIAPGVVNPTQKRIQPRAIN